MGNRPFLIVWLRSSLAALAALGVSFALILIVMQFLPAGQNMVHSFRAMRDAAGVIAFCSILAGFAAAFTSQSLNRHLARQIDAFSAAMDDAANGDLRALGRRYESGELNRLAVQVDGLGQQVDTMLDNERRLSREVSHQLRTPLTALALRIEEIAALDDLVTIRSEAAVAQEQVERLTRVIDQLLALSRGAGAPVADLWLGDLVDAQIKEWAPAFAAQGRTVSRQGRIARRARVNAASTEQVLATLLDNSLVHGAGTVEVTLREGDSWVGYEVVDTQGQVGGDESVDIFATGTSPATGAPGRGLGLALARRLVEADGGRIELVRRDPATFRVFLPVEPATPSSQVPVGLLSVPAPSSEIRFVGLHDPADEPTEEPTEGEPTDDPADEPTSVPR